MEGHFSRLWMRLSSSSFASSPLLINDRFCSRTSSFRCCQYCFSSSLCPLVCLRSKQPRPYVRNKIGSRNKSRERKKEKKRMTRRAMGTDEAGVTQPDTLHLREQSIVSPSSLPWRSSDANPIDWRGKKWNRRSRGLKENLHRRD